MEEAARVAPSTVAHNGASVMAFGGTQAAQ